MNRRTFIKNTVLASGTLFIPDWLNAMPPVAENVQVVIIGAGFSGLAAAYQLHKKGISFVVLESRSRIGGRVFSHQMTDNLVVELGGEWIGNSHTRMQELCDEFKLPLENNQFDTHLIYKGGYSPAGTWDYSPQWKQKFEQLLKDYRQMGEADKHALDQYDWWRYLVNNGCEGRDLDIRELLDSTDFGESIRHVSAFAALSEYAESSPKNEMDLKIKGGNGRLAEAIASKIGREKIHLRQHVSRIVQGDEVTVEFSNGNRFTCHQVICTVPGFALSRINFQPALPPEYTAALNELQYARINKHALHFGERFWKDESFDLVSDQGPHYFYHATKNQKAKDGVLIAYSIGEKAAMNANNKEFAADDVFRCLQPSFGDIKPLLKSHVNYYWGNDEYSRGAYAMYGIGQWFSLRPILEKPFGKVHFAGEHLADWQGFMEGAINTGEAAAEAVI
ncbi:putative flavin-containing monoamine oxidase AofH [Parapedobacter defluvii]|uniref:Tryptophan 2-monooxygenase n=1 Tax=Parapedobacter defluvii TaxID=2045106 RepID=A0ABQ1N1P5_9SPHI|nr:NAD(P)/FAD-dependent oxidoreductase [Parapedobacter defluvii]GGC49203.1 putative flavin-containing monoamine oxidase AofH [Parapedobacter defluvii]